MNWKEIQQKYYNAWFLLGSKKYSHLWPAFDVNTRLLYDFFDEEGICMHIQPHIAGGQPVFYYVIMWRNENHIYEYREDEDLYFNNRTEAEAAAFLEAFSILNDKLKTNE